MRSVFALAMAIGLASAATITDFDVDPESVALRDRGSWCIGERNTCEILCPGAAKENSCNPETLEYACTCNNGTEPGLQFYSASLYSFVCQEAFKQCTANNAGDPIELPKCEDDIQSKCGTLDANELIPTGTDDSGSSEPTGSSDSSSDNSGDSNDNAEPSDSSGSDNEENGAASVIFVSTSAAAVAIGMLAFLL